MKRDIHHLNPLFPPSRGNALCGDFKSKDLDCDVVDDRRWTYQSGSSAAAGGPRTILDTLK